MSNMRIDITPQQILQVVAQLEARRDSLSNEYSKIMTDVDILEQGYEGEASEAFCQRVREYQPTFTQARTVIQSFIDFLRNYANQMRANEDAIRDRVVSNLPRSRFN
jgi:WXG100 family type VII secretion target